VTKKKTLTVKDLRDHLAVCEIAATEDVDPPMTAAEFEALPICVRVNTDDGMHVGGLVSVELGNDHSGELDMIALDAEDTADGV
jgi:hypothetical protein